LRGAWGVGGRNIGARPHHSSAVRHAVRRVDKGN